MVKNLLSFLHEQFKLLYTLAFGNWKLILYSAAREKYTDLLNNVSKIITLFLFGC